MKTRRHVLAVLGATAIAGCAGRATDQPAANETADEPAAEGGSSEETEEEYLTDAQLHDRWIGTPIGDLEETALETYVEGRKEGGIYQGIADTIETVSDEIWHLTDNYRQHHRKVAAITDQILGDQHQLYSFSADASSTTHVDNEFEYSKFWLGDAENEEGETIDINAALTPDTNHETHIKGQKAKNPDQKALKQFRNEEKPGNLPPSDEDAIENSRDHYREHRGREYSEEKIDESDGTGLERFGDYIWGEGEAIPLEGHWDTFDDNIHTAQPNLNEAYWNSDKVEEGERAVFTVEPQEEGEAQVEVYKAPDDYNPATDGTLTEEEIEGIQ